jgi:hypothetical protein
MFKTAGKKGFFITFENGYKVSVQFGAGNYCEYGRNAKLSIHEDSPGSAEAETAIIGPDGKFVKRFPNDYDEVQGYQTPAEVLATMNYAASL